ncbi:hypothetical protein Hanom_Chr09g00834191 [Helianthus anomalus]
MQTTIFDFNRDCKVARTHRRGTEIGQELNSLRIMVSRWLWWWRWCDGMRCNRLGLRVG